ncbi:unknown [Acetobacter sp. CAG:267]|nr:unknown [Acetobacter sp. CAG:267]
MRYWWAMLAGAVLGMSGCQWEQVTDRRTAYYPLQGISTYKGQSVAELWDDNGAPNIVKNMDDGAVMWVYYTNYRPVGGGEIISYDNPAGNGALPGGNSSIPGNGGYMANGNGSIPGSGAMTTAGSNMPAAGSTGTRAASLNSDGGDGLTGNYGMAANYGAFGSGNIAGGGYTAAGRNVSAGNNAAVSCSVKVILRNDRVAAAYSDCN